MKWSKWWPRIADLPAIALAGLFAIFEILRSADIWVAPISQLKRLARS